MLSEPFLFCEISMPFSTLGLNEPILSAVEGQGYTQPTDIQTQAIPHILAGKDVLGCAQTGTGKTAAFALPILQRLLAHPLPTKKQASRHVKPIRCLVLSPTRELAAQIDESFAVYGAGTGLKHTVIFGGVRQKSQTHALHSGVDIVVATPGRLIDLMAQGHVDLRSLEIFVLDEGDRMLDMGFIDDIWHILSYVPEHRQSLLFSATIPAKIMSLAKAILHEPVEVHVAPEMPAAETIEQRMYLVEWGERDGLLKYLLATENVTRALVFTQTKRRADMVAKALVRDGMKVDVIHSDRPMVARMPREAEVYIHRIGRTGRAGEQGIALSFCTVEERSLLDDIEELLGQEIPIIEDHPHPSPLPRQRKAAPAEPKTTGLFQTRRPGRRKRF